jgi:hypothetical protein
MDDKSDQGPDLIRSVAQTDTRLMKSIGEWIADEASDRRRRSTEQDCIYASLAHKFFHQLTIPI